MASENQEHGVGCAFWSNYGGEYLLSGWVIECLCGWQSSRNHEMADTGSEFDRHLEETAWREVKDGK